MGKMVKWVGILIPILFLILFSCETSREENAVPHVLKAIPAKITFPSIGAIAKFEVIFDGKKVNNFKAISKDPEIASVTGDEIKSLAKGSTTLEITYEKYVTSIHINVIPGLKLKRVFVLPTILSIERWGEYSFSITGIDDQGNTFYGLAGTFFVEDPLITQIETTGLVKIGVKNGETDFYFNCCGCTTTGRVIATLPLLPPYALKVISYSLGVSGGFGKDYFPSNVLGPPRGGDTPQSSPKQIFSLGNGGKIILEFADYVTDGPGVDFIVFENPLKNGNSVFTETAFVEVSQDGKKFVRFPSIFKADGEGGTGNPANYINLAGVHPVYANPPTVSATDPLVAGGDQFDLKDVGMPWIRYVRIIDTGYDSRDIRGNIIDDEGNHFPCGPDKCGFDLDAISIVHWGHMVPPE